LPQQLDLLLADGWRHFGTHFFRYNLGFYEHDIRRVIPLRIRLADFLLSKSQRRVLRKNDDLEIVIRPLAADRESEHLFDRHKQRFKSDLPNSIYDFVAADVDSSPTEAMELRVCENGKLCAVSYFDIAAASVSGVYAMFEPSMSTRSLGIFTMLREIEFAANSGKQFYYLGYTYEGNSFYDYKKRFSGNEMFDWSGSWVPFHDA